MCVSYKYHKTPVLLGNKKKYLRRNCSRLLFTSCLRADLFTKKGDYYHKIEQHGTRCLKEIWRFTLKNY